MKPDQSVHKDDGKVPLHLIPPGALLELGRVLAFGAKKYGDDNWRQGMAWRRLCGSVLRHTFAWLALEDRDEESGLHHLAHAACDALFLVQYAIDRVGVDDRFAAKTKEAA